VEIVWSRRLKTRAWAAAVAALWGMAGAAPGWAARSYPSLFGTSEVRSTDEHEFTHWIAMLDRQVSEEAQGDAPCTPAGPRPACAIREWLDFIAAEQGRDTMAQLREVNTHLNLHRYVLDIVNYGIANYWATPRQFAVNDGDCKDYAVAKYFTLRKLGWDTASLRVVVLQDMNLGVAHAVTVAYTDDQAYLMDNQIREVVPASVVRHYRPYYSINEDYWWLHIAKLGR
jgi:predicted transglutaminase-like cysteine proteinase